MAQKTPEDFVEFLKKEKVYRQFMDNLKTARQAVGEKGDMKTFLKEFPPEIIDTITSSAFEWADTDFQSEGFSFWNNIDMKWRKICEK